MKKILCCIMITLSVSMAFCEAKNALLIANGNYKQFGVLKTPVSEAQLLAKSLKKLGFSVTIKNNLSRQQMLDALYDFEDTVKRSGGTALFHYGGHAIQIGDENYLIPVDADIPDERRAASRSVSLHEVTESMQGEVNIIVLDACRNNPLPAAARSSSRGLMPLKRQPKNSIIVYSAESGSVAQDGVFTPILAEKITEAKPLTAILKEVRRAVKDKTKNEQCPGTYDQLDEDVYLAGLPANMTVMTAEAKPMAVKPQSAENEQIPDGFVMIPGGFFTVNYHEDFEGGEDVCRRVAVASYYICDHEVTQAEYYEITGSSPSAFQGDNLPVETIDFRDAVLYCNERSIREGLTPCYTLAERSDADADDGYYLDIQCDFRADGYRLPTEAEWEYAAIGGSKSCGYRYSGSDEIDAVGWTAESEVQQPQEVKSKLPNELGLYDMSGNVMELCWNSNDRETYYAYEDVIPFGSQQSIIVKGGCWFAESTSYESSAAPMQRGVVLATDSGDGLGFRMVRSVR
ncbi:MAG: SUMF1/EgtB/PvdO family nonheme iron enzyme [Spirochaetales bacterium]|nr:SUMF1/EgtB/PvdO family nonheme iron enzyme [Spirochaetales bacterium]